MANISDFRVKHLLLLMGSNPLPDAVDGVLLAAPCGQISLSTYSVHPVS